MGGEGRIGYKTLSDWILCRKAGYLRRKYEHGGKGQESGFSKRILFFIGRLFFDVGIAHSDY